MSDIAWTKEAIETGYQLSKKYRCDSTMHFLMLSFVFDTVFCRIFYGKGGWRIFPNYANCLSTSLLKETYGILVSVASSTGLHFTLPGTSTSIKIIEAILPNQCTPDLQRLDAISWPCARDNMLGYIRRFASPDYGWKSVSGPGADQILYFSLFLVVWLVWTGLHVWQRRQLRKRLGSDRKFLRSDEISAWMKMSSTKETKDIGFDKHTRNDQDTEKSSQPWIEEV